MILSEKAKHVLRVERGIREYMLALDDRALDGRTQNQFEFRSGSVNLS